MDLGKKLEAAFVRYVEEARRYAEAAENLERAEENYLSKEASLFTSGRVEGNNEQERKASLAALMQERRVERLNARVAAKRAELFYKVAEQQLEMMKLLYSGGVECRRE